MMPENHTARSNPERRSGCLFAAAALCFCLLPAGAAAQSDAGDPGRDQLLGQASCAASTCHGGAVGRGPIWRQSLSRFVTADPHARAGLALLNDRSHEIVATLDPAVAELKRQQAGLPPAEQTWTHRRDQVLRRRCISCHATVEPQQCTSQDRLVIDELVEGVSCESCHGAAKSWYRAHLQLDFTGDSRWQSGLRDNESILGRADVCLRCHVGSRSEDGLIRDMNHDLIAAGHPALRFDLLLYDAALPRHWDDTANPRFDQSPVRVRKVGRAASLSAAARLASERAEGYLASQSADRENGSSPPAAALSSGATSSAATSSGATSSAATSSGAVAAVPMPELSDYDCFACHQSLSMDQYRVPVNADEVDLQISAGLPIWNAWYSISLLNLKQEHLRVLAPRPFDRGRAERLARIGEQISQLYLDRAVAASRADFEPRREIAEVLNRMKPSDDWHIAAVNYLDLDAALRELVDQDPDLQTLHQRFADELRPPLGFGRKFDSPAGFDLDESTQFNQAARELLAPVAQ